MKRVVIIGCGAHGREVAEILRSQQRHSSAVQPIGFVDDDLALRGGIVDRLPVLGDWAWFEGVDRAEVAVICASGFSDLRYQMGQRAHAIGLSFGNAISPLAYVSPEARIGDGVVVYPNGVAGRGSSIGNHAIINLGAMVSHDTQLGDYTTLNPGVNLAGNVAVGEGCYLGIGCSVIQGINIGAWTTLGAGAVVISDLPAHVTAVGVPARIIKRHQDTA
jgi:sugar O-acyltransferase (sialic acid O-acetyltransferase NeuD family)